MKTKHLLLVDSDAYSASLLQSELSARGYLNIQLVADVLDIPRSLQASQPEAVIFNYQSDRPQNLIACSTIRLLAPDAAIICLVSPGPALKTVREWSKQSGCIDAFVEKPMASERFFTTIEDILKARESARELALRADRLSSLVPEGALTALKGDFPNDAEMFEAAVLFTDIRGSSGIIRRMPPRNFFALLNQLLSSHSLTVRRFEGTVIKYTGDGVLAIFRGMGRSYLALSCALELARSSTAQALPFGTGVAEGLVLAGFIGDSSQTGQRRQYDVIGATVNLAARLCDLASPGEVIAPRSMNVVARLTTPQSRAIGPVAIKGFDDKVECIAFKPAGAAETVAN